MRRGHTRARKLVARARGVFERREPSDSLLGSVFHSEHYPLDLPSLQIFGPLADSNGEVEGPGTHVGQATRAHNVFPRPRRQTTGASRTPPTMVRSHPHRAPLCACGTAPATEANLRPELSAPKGRTRTPVAPNEDACKTIESATVRTPQSQPKHPPSSSRR